MFLQKLFFILFCIMIPLQIFAESNFEVFKSDNVLFNFAGSFETSVTTEEVVYLATEYSPGGVDLNSVKSVNAFGFRLYKKKKYSEAAVVFRKAVQIDTSYKFAHYNLACMLSLMKGNGEKINPRELIYHLQYAAFLDSNYFKKFRTDPDLDSIRKENYFIDFLNMIEKGELILENKKVLLRTGNRKVFLTELIEGFSGPRSIDPVLELSPDEKSAACIAYSGKNIYLYVVTSYGFAYQVTSTLFSEIEEISGCVPVWQTESKGFIFAYQSSFMFFNVKSLSAKKLLELPFKNQNETFYEIGKYWFSSPSVIHFMGGSSIEYYFSGCEFEIKLNGSGLRRVPGGKVIEPESWQ